MSVFSFFFGSNKNQIFSDDSANGNPALHGESPAGTTQWELWYQGYLRLRALGMYNAEATDQAIDTGGAIAADSNLVTLLHTSSAADKTGVILFQPTTNVFKMFCNTGANSLTFAAAGTSFVSGGTAVVIAGGLAVWMYYSVAKALWYVVA